MLRAHFRTNTFWSLPAFNGQLRAWANDKAASLQYAEDARPGVISGVVDTGTVFVFSKTNRIKLELRTSRQGSLLKLATANGNIYSTGIDNSYCDAGAWLRTPKNVLR